ncbi:MAG: sialidase family protein [Bryobacteraceae bacterium]
MLPSEEGGTSPANTRRLAANSPQGGMVVEGLRFANLVKMKDGSLITERGMQSRDGGRTWQKGSDFKPGGTLGLIRLPNGELGSWLADVWDMDSALGNKTNNWFFKWSSDEGRTWSQPVKITLDGLTQGLDGAMISLRDGKRLVLVTYSQFLGSRFDKRGASWGSLGGVRFQSETEGHFPLAEACRAYYSDDNGRSWKANDGWIMGWRDREKITDAVTEPDLVERKDGSLLLVARSLTGRLYEASSEDRGHSWWPGAKPMSLMSSYSPARICRLPKTGDLMIVWNQQSRAEIRKGYRRSRLSTAISRDEGRTWEHFKNLEAIRNHADRNFLPPDPDLSNVVGDDWVGELPGDYANFHYPSLAVVGEEVFVYYGWNTYKVGEKDGQKTVLSSGGSRTRILPVEWFYQ